MAELPLVLTAGEPSGIGPDLCVRLAQSPPVDARLVIVADRGMLAARAKLLGLPFDLPDHAPGGAAPVSLLHLPTAAPVVPGRLDAANAPYVLATLRRATESCLTGEFAGLVTGPVHKGVINDAGIAFTGHTEFLAARTRTQHVVMMLVGGGLRVALATTHFAVKDIAQQITRDSLERTLRVLQHDLKTRFGIRAPRIAVAGLNPHAGESGHLGREEIDIIIPLLGHLRTEGMQLTGPLPADTLFNPARLRNFDCVLAMYHDQGLPVLKYASFGSGVNVTLGLPLVRTSVDHGTALDLAGTGKADAGSLYAAIELAAQLARATA